MIIDNLCNIFELLVILTLHIPSTQIDLAYFLRKISDGLEHGVPSITVSLRVAK